MYRNIVYVYIYIYGTPPRKNDILGVQHKGLVDLWGGAIYNRIPITM